MSGDFSPSYNLDPIAFTAMPESNSDAFGAIKDMGTAGDSIIKALLLPDSSGAVRTANNRAYMSPDEVLVQRVSLFNSRITTAEIDGIDEVIWFNGLDRLGSSYGYLSIVRHTTLTASPTKQPTMPELEAVQILAHRTEASAASVVVYYTPEVESEANISHLEFYDDNGQLSNTLGLNQNQPNLTLQILNSPEIEQLQDTARALNMGLQVVNGVLTPSPVSQKEEEIPDPYIIKKSRTMFKSMLDKLREDT